MPEDLTAYVLLAIDLVVVALVLTLPLLALFWLIGRVRRAGRRQAPGKTHGAHAPPAATAREGDADQRVLRRCDSCGIGWKGRVGDDKGTRSLRLRRWKRRRARAKKRTAPAWAGRQGWSRCPSCLSTDVRTSSRHTAER